MAHFDRLVRSVRAFSREFWSVSAIPPTPTTTVSTPEPRKTFGLALGGGFARGVSHIGVLKVLEQENIPVDFIAGTSAGAIMGAFYCSGLSAAEIEEVARAARFRDFARWTLSRYGFCSNDRMIRFMARVLKPKTFADLKVPLAITATDFRTGEPVVFTEGELVDPIRASCAYPGMFLPVEFGGRQYVDGMLAYAVPTTPLRQMGAERVMGVYLSAHWASGRPPRHVFEVMGQCLSIAQARLYDLWKKDADLILEPDMGGFAYDCFDRVDELIHCGEQAMRAALPQLRAILNLPGPEAVLAEPGASAAVITASKPVPEEAISLAG